MQAPQIPYPQCPVQILQTIPKRYDCYLSIVFAFVFGATTAKRMTIIPVDNNEGIVMIFTVHLYESTTRPLIKLLLIIIY